MHGARLADERGRGWRPAEEQHAWRARGGVRGGAACVGGDARGQCPRRLRRASGNPGGLIRQEAKHKGTRVCQTLPPPRHGARSRSWVAPSRGVLPGGCRWLWPACEIVRQRARFRDSRFALADQRGGSGRQAQAGCAAGRPAGRIAGGPLGICFCVCICTFAMPASLHRDHARRSPSTSRPSRDRDAVVASPSSTMLSIAELSMASGPPGRSPVAPLATVRSHLPQLAHQAQLLQQQPHRSQQQSARPPQSRAAAPKAARSSAPAGAIVFVDPISSFSPGEVSKQRQTVRSLAMRAARKERWWSTKTKESTDAPNPAAAATTTARARKKAVRNKGKAPVHEPGSTVESVQLVRLPTNLGSSGPYESLIINDNHTAALVNHCKDPRSYLQIPHPSRAYPLTCFADVKAVSPNRPQLAEIRSSWFQLAQSDSAFLNTLLCMSAMHLYAMGSGPAELIYFHKAKVIAGINANMSNDALAMGPANLAAVCNLYCIERSLQRAPWDAVAHLSPTPHQPGVHRQGLRNMVDHRGGLETLTKDRLLYSYILWCVYPSFFPEECQLTICIQASNLGGRLGLLLCGFTTTWPPNKTIGLATA